MKKKSSNSLQRVGGRKRIPEKYADNFDDEEMTRKKSRKANRTKTEYKEEADTLFEKHAAQRTKGMQDWVQQVKKATALPTKDISTGQYIYKPAKDVNLSGLPTRADGKIDALLEGKEEAREKRREAKREAFQKMKEEKRKAKGDSAIFSYCASHLNAHQLADLRKKYPTMMSDTDALRATMGDVYSAVLTSPEQNLYQIHLLLAALRLVEEDLKKLLKRSDENVDIREGKIQLAMLLTLAIGAMLKDVLPSYIIQQVVEPAEGEQAPKTSREQRNLQKHEQHTLFVYKTWLHEHLIPLLNRKFVRESVDLRTRACAFLCDFVSAARLTNFNDEYMVAMIEFACKLPNSKKELLPIIEALQEVFEEDVSLTLAARLAGPLAKKVLALRKNGEGRFVAENHNAAVLLTIFNKIDITGKENAAKREMSRRNMTEGIDLSQSRDKTERDVDAELMKSVAVGLVHGDFKKFKQNKGVVLTELMTLLVKMLRSAHLYPSTVIFEVLRTLANYSGMVNIELMTEIFGELRQMAQTHGQKNESAGCMLFGVVMAALALVKEGTNANAVDTDLSWIGDASLRAVAEVLPYISSGSIQRDEDALVEDVKLDLKDFAHVLTEILQFRKAFGLNVAEIAHISKNPKAVALFTMLFGSRAHSNYEVSKVIDDFVKVLQERFPSLKNLFDQDGLLMDSFDPPKTVAWADHFFKQANLLSR